MTPQAQADAAYAFGLWTGWGLLHSALATRRVKAAFELLLGPRFALYPFAYTAISVWTFWLVLVKEPDMSQVLWSLPLAPKIVLYAAQAVGLAFVLWAGFSMDGAKLLGLPQLWRALRGKLSDDRNIHNDFSTRGAYALVRHPMHSGGILFLLAAPRQTLGGLVFAVFGCAYLLFGTVIEEHRLRGELGRVWDDYASRVPMYVPNLAKRQK